MTTIEDYKPQYELQTYQQIIHFLDWAARKLPGEEFRLAVVLKYSSGKNRIPSEGSDLCKKAKKNKNYICKILDAKYNRWLAKCSDPNKVRATKDSEDYVDWAEVPMARQLAKKQQELNRRVKKTPESSLPVNSPHRAWVRMMNLKVLPPSESIIALLETPINVRLKK